VTAGLLAIEVVYARPERQTLIALTLPIGATAADAIVASGLRDRHPELAEQEHAIGVFGRVVSPDRKLENGDRVEVYRPLVADPKAGRNERVARQRAKRESVRNMRAGPQT
jgi:uncharacterized protein